MVQESVYTSLLSWLCPAMEAEYKRKYGKLTDGSVSREGGKLRGWKGKWDKQVLQYRVDRLRTVVRQLVCEDKVMRFLSDGGRGAIYAYNGICFVRIEDREIFLKELLKRAFMELDLGEKYNDEYPSKVIAMSCLDTILSSDKYLYRPNRRYVAFRNVVYDVENRKAVKPSVEQCPAIVLDLEYKDKDELYRECAREYGTFENPCKLWDDKIVEIIPDRGARLAFQQWCGALIADKSRFKLEYCLFLVGPGANGKSVVSNTIASVFGKEYFSCFSFRQLFKDSDRNVNIAALVNKVANFIDDMDGKELSGGDFKRFTSGGEFQGRVPYEKKPVKVFAPPLLCCANAMPETDDDSYGGQRRRLVVHTTTRAFTGKDRDTSLTYKLTRPEALMYIFHWIVEGYRVFAKNRGDILIDDEMRRAQEIVMAGSNSMRRWWAENGYEAVKVYDKDCWRSLAELYDEYKAFVEAEGSKQYVRPELSAMLTQKGCYKERKGVGYGFCLRKRYMPSESDSAEYAD